MKSYLYLVFASFVIIGVIQTVLIMKNKALKEDADNCSIVVAQQGSVNGYLQSCISSSIRLNGLDMDKLSIMEGVDSSTITSINKLVEFPCLVVFIPRSEKVCTSCIDYAVDAVKPLFPDFKTSNQILVLSCDYNPLYRLRTVGRHVFHIVGHHEPNAKVFDEEQQPLYFVLSADCLVNYCFTPSAYYPVLVEKYLSQVKNAYLSKSVSSIAMDNWFSLEYP